MSRQPHAGGPYVTPLLTDDGSAAVSAGPRGQYTLTTGKTYVYLLGGPDATVQSAHFTWDASIVITSLTVEDCNMPDSDVSPYSTTAGEWIDEDPASAFVGTVGAGVTVTSGVVAVAGGAVGGCMFHITGTGANRTRIKAVVGGTGGVVRCGNHGKD